ncbi:signal peptidase complex subunit 1 [Pluvialis apricaria]
MEDGAERRGRVSGHLSSRFPVSLHRGGRRAQQRYPPGRPAASASQGDAGSWQPPRGSDYEEEQDCDCEAPLSAAAMLNIFRSIPTQMDYKGQKLAEQIFQGIILVSAIIGFIYGYVTEQFGWTVYIVMAGFALSCLLTLPPWPMYRRNPLKWLPVQESGTDEKKPADRKPKRHAKS